MYQSHVCKHRCEDQCVSDMGHRHEAVGTRVTPKPHPSLPLEAPTETAGVTHLQPLPPVGDPSSEGIRPVPEVPLTGAQLADSSIPTDTWNAASPYRTRGLAWPTGDIPGATLLKPELIVTVPIR